MSNKNEIKQKIIRTGNSAAVTIPYAFMDTLNLRIGDEVTATLDFEKGTITYSFPAKRQLVLKSTPRRRL